MGAEQLILATDMAIILALFAKIYLWGCLFGLVFSVLIWTLPSPDGTIPNTKVRLLISVLYTFGWPIMVFKYIMELKRHGN